MKWSSLFSAVLAMLGMVGSVNAGSVEGCCGAQKSCGCGPSSQAPCCRPTICRPTCPNVCTYQRSCCKPSGCCDNNGGCGPKACAPACGPAAAPACTAPAACAPACTAPAACAPAATCAPKGCAPACGSTGCGTNCGAPKSCCNADPCEIAHWIYVSQTACYAKDRAKAIDKIGDCYDCTCNPEIMCALIYGLNDADERVRREAAEEIYDQLKQHPCCCNEKVVCALTAALADCDCRVARGAEKALRCCGYDVVDCSKPSCGTNGCGAKPGCGACGAMAAAPAPAAAVAAPAPAPVPVPVSVPSAAPTSAPAVAPSTTTEPEAYFPSRLKTSQAEPSKKSLSNLFGLRR